MVKKSPGQRRAAGITRNGSGGGGPPGGGRGLPQARHDCLWGPGCARLSPGPNSTELAINIGYQQAGWPGLLVAGACFILPASLIVTGVAYLYVTYGRLAEMQGILYGVKPVVTAIVLQALWRLGRSAVKSIGLAALGVAAVGAAVAA